MENVEAKAEEMVKDLMESAGSITAQRQEILTDWLREHGIREKVAYYMTQKQRRGEMQTRVTELQQTIDKHLGKGEEAGKTPPPPPREGGPSLRRGRHSSVSENAHVGGTPSGG